MTPPLLKRQNGSALITVLIITAIVAAMFVVYSTWTTIGNRAVIHSLQTQKAVYNAQSGYYSALDYLKQPFAVTLTTMPVNLGSMTDGATYYLSLAKSINDPSLVNLTTTGYFEIPGGHFQDPQGNAAEMGIIDATVRLVSVKDYFAAVPGTLAIANGTNIAGGSVYGKDLLFVTGPLTTQIGAAFYLNSVTPSATPPPSLVTFTQLPNNAQQLVTAPRLPQVTPMQDGYYAMANDPNVPCILPNPGNVCTLTNASFPLPANPSNVCYCAGDLHLGDNTGPLTVSGVVVIFVQGSTYIGNSVNVNDITTDWMAVASEGDVLFQNNPPGWTVPHTMSVFGTFLTDGSIGVQGNPIWADGNLSFTGGIISQKTISLAAFSQSRVYAYHAAPVALKLPFLVQSVSWTIRHGKNY
jgi:hypothetical protein